MLLVLPLFTLIIAWLLSITKATVFRTAPATAILISFTLGYVFADLWVLGTCHYLKLDGHQEIKGLHLHHSLYFIASTFLSLVFLVVANISLAEIIFVWGVGVLMHHTLHEKRIVFVERITHKN